MAKSDTAVSSGRLESNVDQHLTNNTVCLKFFWSSRPRFLENVSIGEKGLKRGSRKTVSVDSGRLSEPPYTMKVFFEKAQGCLNYAVSTEN